MEKQAVFVDASRDEDSSNHDAAVHDFHWDEAEEKRLVRKIDLIVMPLLILGFWVLQLDRGNIGFALTDFFLRDVGITQDQFNIGQQLLSVGIVILEIPNTMVLYWLGPRLWIGGQIFIWGLVATFQAFQKGLGSFLATRLLLGLCESGFIPAGFYTLTTWYKRDETSKRFSWYFLGTMIAQACSGLIAYGILQMRGVCNLAGWQWMFIIEGLLTICVSFLFIALFPKDPSHPVPFVGTRYFSERETKILTQRVLNDDPSKIKKRPTISLKELGTALSNWCMYPHFVTTIIGMATTVTLMTYGPTLVSSWGYDRLKSNLLVSVGSWIAIVVNILWGTLADITKKRGLMVFLGIFFYWAFCLASKLLTGSDSKSARYGVLVMALSVATTWHPINGSWLALNARSASERSMTMACFIMAANTAGIIGSQTFRAADAPLYNRGWNINIGLLSGALLVSIYLNIQYRVLNWYNAKNDKGTSEGSAIEGAGIVVVEGKDNIRRHYHL